MKKLITLVLTISMLFSLSGCSYVKQVKKDAIKARVLSFFSSGEPITASKDNGNFNELFEPFLQDFLITRTNSESSIRSIWKKGYLLTIDYKSTAGSLYSFYSPTKGKTFRYLAQNKKVTSVGATPTEEDPTTLFAAFGLDISMYYNKSVDDENTPTLRDMTTDDLTVSDDLLTCHISSDYIKELAKTTYVNDESYSEEQIDAYFSAFSGSGVFMVEERKLTINFGSDNEDAPLMDVTMEITWDENEKFDAVITVKNEQEIEEKKVPIEITLRLSNFQFADGKPVTADIKTTSSFQYTTDNVGGNSMTMEMTQTYVCKIDVSDESAHKKLLLTTEQASKITEGSEVLENTSEIYFEIDTTKSEERLIYRIKNDQETDVEILADFIVFGDHDEVAPENVRMKYSGDSK